jgi:hypothetical protein
VSADPTTTAAKVTAPTAKRVSERASFYVWTAIVLTVAVAVVILGWHARGGTTDPTALPPGHRLSRTTVVLDSAILVLREGLEAILVLAAVMASFLGGNRVYRRPVALGGGRRSAPGSRPGSRLCGSSASSTAASSTCRPRPGCLR